MTPIEIVRGGTEVRVTGVGEFEEIRGTKGKEAVQKCSVQQGVPPAVTAQAGLATTK